MPKFRSGSEQRLYDFLKKNKVKHRYEPHKIKYHVSLIRSYLPDFLLPNSIVLEVKGRFTTADRQKHLYIRQNHPLLDIRFVFDNPKSKLYKGSKTTYAEWCEKHNFIFCSAKDKDILLEWCKEKSD